MLRPYEVREGMPMARSAPRGGENETLIELSRLRRELAHVRREMAHDDRRRGGGVPVRRGSTPLSARKLKARVGMAMLAAMAAFALAACYLVYRALEAVMGGVVDGLVPEPARVTVNALVDLVALIL